MTGWALWVHYALQFGPGVIFSFIEALVISYDFLATAIALTKVVGISLWREPMDALRVFVSNSITAEALELGHPNNIRYGINPLKGSNKFMLWLCGVLYSLRSGISKFIVKIIIRRVVSRSAVRGASSSNSAAMSLISLPIVAFWNAILAVGVMKNVRTVTLGRANLTLCVDTVMSLYLELTRQMNAGVPLQMAVDLARTRSNAVEQPELAFHNEEMPREMAEAIIRTFAISVIFAREFHPNLETMIKHVCYRLRMEPENITDVDDFMARFLQPRRPVVLVFSL